MEDFKAWSYSVIKTNSATSQATVKAMVSEDINSAHADMRTVDLQLQDNTKHNTTQCMDSYLFPVSSCNAKSFAESDSQKYIY